MKLIKEIVFYFLLVIIGLISVSDLLIRPGHPITFDGHIHMTAMNQFAQSLKDGEFPVTWSNNFANYGLPLPLFAHQFSSYLGASLILLGLSTESAYIMLITFGVILSSFLYYFFFKKYASSLISLTASTLATFFSYRSLDIYTRGALPEILSTVFLPILFLGIWNIQQKKYFKATTLLFLGTLALSLTHPMMLLIFSIPLSIYFFFNLDKIVWRKQIIMVAASSILGVITASYYLIPLLLEMKYFYQGFIETNVSMENFLKIKQLYDSTWFYTLTHPGPRANYIKLGFFEFSVFITSILVLLNFKFKILSNNIDKKNLKQLLVWVLMSFVSIILMLPISKALYSIPILAQIQYPWRFLNVLQFLIPGLFVMLTLTIKKMQNKYFLLFLISLILWFRVPQFYGKNYITQLESDYEFNIANLHSVNMNPIWSDNSQSYPTKTTQAKIIEGNGTLEFLELKNASRKYKIDAINEVRMIDYTFYFPGWKVYSDNNPIDIQYQDVNYRGLITYKIPSGSHIVTLKYEPTRLRLLANLLTLAGLTSSIIFLIIVKKKY